MELLSIGLGFYLQVQAARAFKDMQAAAAIDGVKLKVNTAFRSMDYQKELRRRYDEATARGIAYAPAAKPGYSNHQSGIAVDINRAEGDNPKTKAYDSPVDNWLAKNAERYHFHRTVDGEPWHFEYRPDLDGKGGSV